MKEKKNSKIKLAIKSLLAALGLTTLVSGGAKLLNSSNESSKTQNEISTELDNSKTNHQEFAKGLEVKGIEWEPIPESSPSLDTEETLSKKELSPEELKILEDRKADDFMRNLVASYNEIYNDNLSVSDLKFLETDASVAQNNMYISDSNNYVYDISKSGGQYDSSYTRPEHSFTICSVIDGRAEKGNSIIYSIGKYASSNENKASYTDVYVTKTRSGDFTDYGAKYDENNTLKLEQIYIDEDLKGFLQNENSFAQKMYEACSNECTRAEQAKKKGNVYRIPERPISNDIDFDRDDR